MLNQKIIPNTLPDIKRDPWLDEIPKQPCDRFLEYLKDPHSDHWDFQACMMGYENGEEFKKFYRQRAERAVVAGVTAGTGTFLTAFGLSVLAIEGGGLLPSIGGILGRAIGGAIKSIGFRLWNGARSAWYAVTRAAATPQGQEAIKKTAACVESLIEENPESPKTVTGAKCYLTNKAVHLTNGMTNEAKDKESNI